MTETQNKGQPNLSALSNNEALHRFEWHEAGETSYITYHHDGGLLVLDHSFVPKNLAGRGVGSRMVKAALDELLRSDRKIAVRCDFIEHVISGNEAYRSLLQH